MKKIICGLLLLSFIFTVAACGKKESGYPTDSEKPFGDYNPKDYDYSETSRYASSFSLGGDSLCAIVYLGNSEMQAENNFKAACEKYFSGLSEEDISAIKTVGDTGNERYLIIPKYENQKVIANEILPGLNGGYNRKGTIAETEGPFVLRCNISQFFADTELIFRVRKEETALCPRIGSDSKIETGVGKFTDLTDYTTVPVEKEETPSGKPDNTPFLLRLTGDEREEALLNLATAFLINADSDLNIAEDNVEAMRDAVTTAVRLLYPNAEFPYAMNETLFRQFCVTLFRKDTAETIADGKTVVYDKEASAFTVTSYAKMRPFVLEKAEYSTEDFCKMTISAANGSAKYEVSFAKENGGLGYNLIDVKPIQ